MRTRTGYPMGVLVTLALELLTLAVMVAVILSATGCGSPETLSEKKSNVVLGSYVLGTQLNIGTTSPPLGNGDVYWMVQLPLSPRAPSNKSALWGTFSFHNNGSFGINNTGDRSSFSMGFTSIPATSGEPFHYQVTSSAFVTDGNNNELRATGPGATALPGQIIEFYWSAGDLALRVYNGSITVSYSHVAWYFATGVPPYLADSPSFQFFADKNNPNRCYNDYPAPDNGSFGHLYSWSYYRQPGGPWVFVPISGVVTGDICSLAAQNSSTVSTVSWQN